MKGEKSVRREECSAIIDTFWNVCKEEWRMRRTKEEAAHTRARIVDAGLTCFDRYGIAGSTLDQIAAEAGVSKGAIYHHFAGKREILHEIREQVSLPFLDEADTALLGASEVPALARIERFLEGVLHALEHDERKRRALAVMQFKCEYVDVLAPELAGALRANERLWKAFEAAYREAGREGTLAAGLVPEVAALETLLFLGGLLRLWLLHAPRSLLRRKARAAIQSHMRLRHASPGVPPRGT
jgi:TetR/AcrR family acrAB operon transcriptional repressor